MENLTPEDFDYMMKLNLRAPLTLINLFEEDLVKSKGCVVNISCDKG